MKFSIVVPMKEITDYFREAIPYFERQNFKDFELIILPNGGGKNEFKNLKNVKVINTGAVSPGIKRNIGVKNSKGEIIAFIDDDAYPEKDWLEKANENFKDKNIVAVGGPSLVPHNATFFQRISNKVYELSSGKTGIRYGEHKKIEEIDDWPACNLFVRRKDFNEVGGFNTKYFGGEDTQVCYSLLKTSKRMIYNPKLIIYHHPRKSLSNHIKQTLFWAMWRGFFMRIYPKNSIRLTFFMPALFILGLFLGGILSLIYKPISYLYFGILGFYFLFLIFIGLRTKSVKLFFPVIFVTAITHLMYGIGFFIGLFAGKYGPTRSGMHPKENLKTNRK
ncbi:MAG: glycosyltransferase [archaeon]|nr:glycosyltransferase [archaeon]